MRVCNFPLPFWVKRELLNPLTGGGIMSDSTYEEHGKDCPTWESKP